jgi:hypothetical protein
MQWDERSSTPKLRERAKKGFAGCCIWLIVPIYARVLRDTGQDYIYVGRTSERGHEDVEGYLHKRNE